MLFWNHLIKTQVKEINNKFLKNNAVYVKNGYWLYEGDIGCLDDELIKYQDFGEHITPWLSEMTTKDLIKLIKDNWEIDVNPSESL